MAKSTKSSASKPAPKATPTYKKGGMTGKKGC
jgi:hypothetical protein